MSKRKLDVGIENVNEVYDGPGGILWEMLMGEQIHVGGADETDILARKAKVTASSHVLDVCSALGGHPPPGAGVRLPCYRPGRHPAHAQQGVQRRKPPEHPGANRHGEGG